MQNVSAIALSLWQPKGNKVKFFLQF